MATNFESRKAQDIAEELYYVEEFPDKSVRDHIFVDGIRTIATNSEKLRG